ncbi:copper-exporting P-type ATPase A, partial [Arthrobacter sp. Hiyo6]
PLTSGNLDALGGRRGRRGHRHLDSGGRPGCGDHLPAGQHQPGSAAAISRLRQLGLRPILLTGDNAAVAAEVAAAVGIPAEDVFAGVLPEGKVDAVRKLQAAGAR